VAAHPDRGGAAEAPQVNLGNIPSPGDATGAPDPLHSDNFIFIICESV
jgi:hypothetical protein